MRQFINNNHCQPSQLVHLSTFALNHDTLPEIIGFALCSSTIICKHGCMVKIIKIRELWSMKGSTLTLPRFQKALFFVPPVYSTTTPIDILCTAAWNRLMKTEFSLPHNLQAKNYVITRLIYASITVLTGYSTNSEIKKNYRN